MRIAQVAPLWELVPPRTYGGSELVVYNLTEELVRQGHEVTLFAAQGSETAGTLVPCAPMALREMEEQINKDKTHCTVMAYESAMLQTVFERAHEFDVIHNHIGYQALPFASFVPTPVVTTLHNALDPLPVKELFLRNAHLPYISISDYQQQLWPELNYAATIHHGIDLAKFNPSFEHEGKDYLLFLGRLSPEKGPHHAIRIAQELDMPLLIAGKIDRVDRMFYDREIAHLVDGERIKYVGEVNHEQKVELMRNAAATLCPVEWPEPFGLVMIESMACGTPVFALRDGSIPEVIDSGVTGYVATSVDELIGAVREYRHYDRKKVREVAERRFSVKRMVDDHLRLYANLIEQAQARKPEARAKDERLPVAVTGTPDLLEGLLTPGDVVAKKNAAMKKRDGNGKRHADKSLICLNQGREILAGLEPEQRLTASLDSAPLDYYPDLLNSL
jgi:glycosyltransferase involved in cell wall biosynthesis